MEAALNDLRKVLTQFNRDDLFDTVIPLLELSETQIVEDVKKLRVGTNKTSVADAVISCVKKNGDYSEEYLKSLVLKLETYSVAVRPNKKNWTAYSLNGAPMFEEVSPYDVQKAVKRTFRINNIETIVSVVAHKSIWWINLKTKAIQAKKLRVSPPLYCAVFIREPYLFTSRSIGDSKVLQCLTEALGYIEFKSSGLYGDDLKSLVAHLKSKGVRRAIDIPVPDDVLESSFGIDFSQHVNRRNYVDEMFGPDPPKIPNFQVVIKSVPWESKYYEDFTPTIVETVFKTKDSIEFFRDLAENNGLTTPLPAYFSNVLSSGKNKLKMKPLFGNSVATS